MTPVEQLRSVLCDQTGKCSIAGSDQDRAIIERALQGLAAPVQEPVWIQPDHLQKAQKAPFLCRVEPNKRDDFVPLYTAPPAQPAPVQEPVATLFGSLPVYDTTPPAAQPAFDHNESLESKLAAPVQPIIESYLEKDNSQFKFSDYESDGLHHNKPAPVQEPSPTAGMNMAQRILHVGGRNNVAGYVEFGSIQAVEALVRQVLRDLHAPRKPLPAHEIVTMYEESPTSDSDMIAFARAIEAAHGITKGQP
jgi:hypothetical protein